MRLNVVVAAAGVIATGGTMAVAGAGDLMMHASSDNSVSPMRTDHAGSGGAYEPTAGFRGSEFSKDEIVEFVNGHTGDGNSAMGRPTPAEVDIALSKGSPEKMGNRNAEKFEYNGVRVIVNYDMPWKSTSYYPGK